MAMAALAGAAAGLAARRRLAGAATGMSGTVPSAGVGGASSARAGLGVGMAATG